MRHGNIILPTHLIPQGVPSTTKQPVSNTSIGTAKVNLTSKWDSFPEKSYEIAPITGASDASLGVKLPGIKQVQTPYHIQHMVTSGIVPLTVKWEGPAYKLIITVEYIIRPTSPRLR